jgi:hypothetical protein
MAPLLNFLNNIMKSTFHINLGDSSDAESNTALIVTVEVGPALRGIQEKELGVILDALALTAGNRTAKLLNTWNTDIKETN